tara:strand:+ start:140 stop:1144 length:1005 start_codon:yes stop_codon:yes gene_type:complete
MDNKYEEYNVVNGFFLDKKNVLFFDIFIKNNKLYLIRPLHKNEWRTENNIKSSIKVSYKSKDLICLDEIKEYHDGPIIILIYDFNFDSEDIYEIRVIFDEKIKLFKLKHKKTYKKKKLALTTLFKSDYKLIKIFYEYYKKQGVDHFYMYYNGTISDDIKKYYNKEDITLMEWNYVYNNKDSVLPRHYAQPGQMHDALYRFGKDEYEYMLFCDLDEYLYIKDKKLIELVRDESVDTFGFRNLWANTKNYNVPDNFPNEFYITTDSPLKYSARSKAIHKTDTVIHVSIHTGTKYKSKDINIKSDNIMFQFHSWGGQNCKLEKTDKLINLDNFEYPI